MELAFFIFNLFILKKLKLSSRQSIIVRSL